MQYRAPAWTSLTSYLELTGCGDRGDLVTPTASNGFLYEAVSSGVSDSVEPTWPSVTDATVDDGTVQWKAIPDVFNMLSSGDVITVSDWFADDDAITLSDDSVAGGRAYVKVSTVPSYLSQFILTNRVTIQRQGGLVETIDRSLKIKVKEM